MHAPVETLDAIEEVDEEAEDGIDDFLSCFEEWSERFECSMEAKELKMKYMYMYMQVHMYITI